MKGMAFSIMGIVGAIVLGVVALNKSHSSFSEAVPYVLAATLILLVILVVAIKNYLKHLPSEVVSSHKVSDNNQLVIQTRQAIENETDPKNRAALEQMLQESMAVDDQAAIAAARLKKAVENTESSVRNIRRDARIFAWAIGVAALFIIGKILAKNYW